ncbi:hypothetical protein [Streptomyces sp. URMC 129]|uniref:hypothetical protein n=1 Tax=Streptomyces sp. URMC 129 TaxID=3423407 RepID=UPI003F1B41B5
MVHDLKGKEARDWGVANREQVTGRYLDGQEPMSGLARSLKVSATWLTRQFDTWGVPRRDRAKASELRGPGVNPYKSR